MAPLEHARAEIDEMLAGARTRRVHPVRVGAARVRALCRRHGAGPRWHRPVGRGDPRGPGSAGGRPVRGRDRRRRRQHVAAPPDGPRAGPPAGHPRACPRRGPVHRLERRGQPGVSHDRDHERHADHGRGRHRRARPGRLADQPALRPRQSAGLRGRDPRGRGSSNTSSCIPGSSSRACARGRCSGSTARRSAMPVRRPCASSATDRRRRSSAPGRICRSCPSRRPEPPPTGLSAAAGAAFGTIAPDAATRRGSGPAHHLHAGRRDPTAVRGVLRRARACRRAQREPGPGGRPDPAVHELRHGPVQGGLHRAGDALATPARWTTSAACGSRASTTTSRRSAGRPRHHTLFEMLGNWSFGDYFKREAIQYAWDFLTHDLGIPADRLAVTTYTDDEVSRAIWRDEIGIPPERMARWGDVDHGDDHNFWRMAETGPCGPCSEIHFDRGAHLSEGPECVPDHSESCPRWLEIWNLVFMEFDQRPDGRVPLPFTERRHRDGAGARRERRPAGPVQLRHGPVRPDPRADARAARPRPGGLRGRALQLPGHRRPLARRHVPHRRRRPALERGARLRPAPDPPPRRAPRPAARAAGAVHGGDGRRSSSTSWARRTRTSSSGATRSSRPSPARRRSSRGRSAPARGCWRRRSPPLVTTDRIVGRRPEDLPDDAPRLSGDVAFKLHDTFGFPIDLTDRAGGRARRRRRPRRLRRGARRAARPLALGQEGRAVEARRTDRDLPGRPGARRRHRVPRLRDHDRRRARGRDPARRDSNTTS